jgi:hypothetical protein
MLMRAIGSIWTATLRLIAAARLLGGIEGVKCNLWHPA